MRSGANSDTIAKNPVRVPGRLPFANKSIRTVAVTASSMQGRSTRSWESCALTSGRAVVDHVLRSHVERVCHGAAVRHALSAAVIVAVPTLCPSDDLVWVAQLQDHVTPTSRPKDL